MCRASSAIRAAKSRSSPGSPYRAPARPALTCLTSDHSAAAFAVTGEADAFYTISLPSEIKIVNERGTAMRVADFTGSKAKGQLLKGEDSFTVGGTLEVAARQEAGQYKGSFTVAVEYQ
ncbi:hypothetical protein CAP39_07885 [Sphingomonas sp. IBVSS1]|nr:hypothetical protein CAP39_07885 [Sphingomonas sp. IBVSS1]